MTGEFIPIYAICIHGPFTNHEKQTTKWPFLHCFDPPPILFSHLCSENLVPL